MMMAAILKILQPRLMGKSFEEICLLLRQLPQDLSESTLFEAIHTITVPEYCKKARILLSTFREGGMLIPFVSFPSSSL